MIDKLIFNKEISNFLKERGNDAKVNAFKNANIYHSDYLDFLDWFTYDLGFFFMNEEVVDEKNHEKTLGYSPKLRVYNENVFNEKEEDIQLSKEWLDLKTSSVILAKKVINKIFNFSDLEIFIEKKNYIKVKNH